MDEWSDQHWDRSKVFIGTSLVAVLSQNESGRVQRGVTSSQPPNHRGEPPFRDGGPPHQQWASPGASAAPRLAAGGLPAGSPFQGGWHDGGTDGPAEVRG